MSQDCLSQDKQDFFFRQQFIFQQELSQQELQGFEQGKCYLKGYLTNEEDVCEQLNIESGDQQALLDAALKHWGHQVNQHLYGDYLLVRLNGEQLLVTSSARASFTLYYYQEHEEHQTLKGLALSTNLNRLTFQGEATVNQAHLLQTLALGPLAGKNTCFEKINQLQCGETLIWQLQPGIKLSHQARLSDTEQLILAQRNKVPPAEPIAPRVIDDVDLTGLFNQLPSLAHRLGEPVMDVALAHFDSLVQASSADTLLLDVSWLTARNIIGEQGFYNSHTWCKGILKRPMLDQRSQLQQRQNQLLSAFEAAQSEQLEPNESLSFGQWLDLHYVIPAWCQILQRICQNHGKTLINPYIQAKQLIAVVEQTDHQPQAYFSLQQLSLANIYDAMQRLFYIGEPGTLKLFNLNPLNTARLIRCQTDQPRRVEQLSVILLTLDYLARFHPGRLN